MERRINKKIVILGIDGMGPKILEEGFKKNLYPNLWKLKQSGYYSKLQTTMPPQSPVAWASFSTGVDPAHHGIYDFIVRNASDYSLELVWAQKLKHLLRATPFWETLSKYKIPSTVLFLPDSYPPSKLYGRMISGMGTPDILGNAGLYTLFTTKKQPEDSKRRGKIELINNGVNIKTKIKGPKYETLNEKKTAEVPLTIEKTKDNEITLKVQNQTLTLKENEFSNWVRMEFKIDFFTKIHGVAKFYLKSLSPDLELYLSSINFDPEKPVYPISYPKSYSKDLSRQYGIFSTLGLPHDTWALEENVFDNDVFLNDADNILEERKKIYFGELKKLQKGLFFAYFGITDTIQHMYWRYLDKPQSPYQDTISRYYQKVDGIIGDTMKSIRPQDTLIMLSDHGFDKFDYEINLNTWLKENGYLTLKSGKEIGSELLADVDWSKTKTYAIGYNGIYFNLRGREGKGSIDKKETERLEKKLVLKLLSMINPFDNSKVIKKIYTKKDLKISTDDKYSPDLFIGYYKGIRSSWDTAVGAGPKEVIKKREGKWSGDHLFDPTEVPGVLLANKNLFPLNPKITDVIPAVFKLFSIFP